MNNLQKLLQTQKSTDQLSSWNMAFVVTDGRSEYSTPIYNVLLEALMQGGFSGKMLVFARDIFGISQHPAYLVQLVPVTTEKADEVRGPGFAAFQEFCAVVAGIAGRASGMTFLADFAELGNPYEPIEQSILRGNITWKNGEVTIFTPAGPEEQTLFEESFLERFPDALQEPADDLS